MMQLRRRHMRRLYSNWQARALACKIADNWTCQHCGVKQFALHYSIAGNPYIIYLHAAHVHPDDPIYATRDLITLCISCHARYDIKTRARAARVRIERLKHRRLLGKWRLRLAARIACACIPCL